MLQLSGFQKFYGRQLIVSIPELELPAGIYWLQGENGSGKTTLMKSVAGLLPFHGEVRVHGADIRRQRMAYRQAVSYAEAEPVYPPFLTGNDLLSFYASARLAPGGQVDALKAAFGIGGYAGNETGTYSSGMAKKLSLALAFTGAPRLILLDEPLITLDTQSVSTLQKQIVAGYRNGTTFIISSHQDMFQGAARLLTSKAITYSKITFVPVEVNHAQP